MTTMLQLAENEHRWMAAKLLRHAGHALVVAVYGDAPRVSTALECSTCNAVIIDADDYDIEED